MQPNRLIIPSGSVIDGYEIIDLVGVGGFCAIYKVKDQKSNDFYAMKTENINSNGNTLLNEITILKNLHDDFFPRYHQYGINEEYQIQYLVMNYLGMSIGGIQMFNDYVIDMETVYHISLIMLGIIEAFHMCGYVHRDIKPNNFLIQHINNYPIVMIDFGLSKKFIDPHTKKPFPSENENFFIGTRKYASFNVMNLNSWGRNDDLISWFYSFLDLATNDLPWTKSNKNDEIMELKSSMTFSDFNYKFPDEFKQIYNYLIKLNYNYIKDLFHKGMENDLYFVGEFDWPIFINKYSHMRKYQTAVGIFTLNVVNRRNNERNEKLIAKKEKKLKKCSIF